MILEAPASSEEDEKGRFYNSIDDICKAFTTNGLCRKLDDGSVTLLDYQLLLRALFHQVEIGSGSFAMAAASCNLRERALRRYFIKHAEEEKAHSEWIEADLHATGYDASGLASEPPTPAVAAYIAFNFYTAQSKPIARLGIALMLETLGAEFGGMYARKLVQQLGLGKEHIVFLSGHSVSDVGHVLEIREVLEENVHDEESWKALTNAARVAGTLYKEIYDEVAARNSQLARVIQRTTQ